MDLQRVFLFLIFSFSLMLVWDGWKNNQHPEQVVAKITASDQEQTKLDKVQTSLPTPNTGSELSPPVDNVTESQTIKGVTQSLSSIQPDQKLSAKIIHVKTDFLDVEISTIGGDISRLALLKQPDNLDKSKPFVLFERGEGTHNYVAQSGLLGAGLPNHNSLFVAEQNQYELSENSEQIQVKLVPQGDSNLKVIKVIAFHKSSYLIDISYELENISNSPVTASTYFQLIRDSAAPSDSTRFLPTYTGAAAYTDKEKFQKVSFSDIEKDKTKYIKHADDGWIGVLQHYFVSAWLPKQNTPREYYTRKLDGNQYSVGMIFPQITINPGKKVTVATALYAGPTESNLNNIAPGLGLTVDYGWLTIIATPLFWIMSIFNHWVHNWGLSIILLTILIKILFFPLSAASYRSMAKMRLVAPKLEKIKQQYADDREQLNRAMMELYKTEKINPLGGCLPVLIQIPVFIALYWSILSSVEMRYAPFFGWITNLSAADPYYILPLIMGATMMIQMSLNPKPPDPLQAKIMQIMPIAFSVMFFFFPAGLVLYSIVNNTLSIVQQWFITRAAEDESKARA